MGAHAWDYTAAELRALAEGLMRRADALDPDAAIAEAERRMVEAGQRCSVLATCANEAGSDGPRRAFSRALECAVEDERAAVNAWLALVEARGAKGGGA